MKLDSAFFRRPAVTVARELLGKYLCRKRGSKIERRMITETEAYIGPQDKASHAHRGKTARNAPMFGDAGVWYVYFVYGMHWLLNVVTGPHDWPAAVLIRGVEGAPGPARLTKALGIDRKFNGLAATRATGLWIEDRGVRIAARNIKKTPRIGVDYAGEWAKKPYRYMLGGK
jgi:DNA-3-methyladenine glycosylase